MNDNANIKLFVSCHQPNQNVPPHPLLTPIQVGAALSETLFPNFIHDQTGDNISQKNKIYCELTAQYWAWKNSSADYYGFFHYRRYLFPKETVKPSCIYIVKPPPTLRLLDSLGYSYFHQIISEYDLIVPRKENMHVPVRQHYALAPYHHKEDLDLVEKIIEERFPEFISAKNRYLSGTSCYFGNIFIMRSSLFQAYCNWLFSILEQFETQKDLSTYSMQEKRVAGYLGERLLGIFVTYCKQLSDVHILELPRVHFEGSQIKRTKQVCLNLVFPPGSKRRARLKHLVHQTKPHIPL